MAGLSHHFSGQLESLWHIESYGTALRQEHNRCLAIRTPRQLPLLQATVMGYYVSMDVNMHKLKGAVGSLTQQQVSVEAPLMGFIQQNDAVRAQQEVRLQLAHQHTVRQEAHCTRRTHTPVVTNLQGGSKQQTCITATAFCKPAQPTWHNRLGLRAAPGKIQRDIPAHSNLSQTDQKSPGLPATHRQGCKTLNPAPQAPT